MALLKTKLFWIWRLLFGRFKGKRSVSKNKRISGFKGFFYARCHEKYFKTHISFFLFRLVPLYLTTGKYKFEKRSPRGVLEKKRPLKNLTDFLKRHLWWYQKKLLPQMCFLGMFCKFPEQVLIRIIKGT